MSLFSGLTNIQGVGDIVAKVGIDGAEAFKDDLNKLTGSTLSFSNKGMVALGAYMAAATALFAAVAKGVGVASEFEYGMAKVNTILKLSESDMQKLNEQVLEISRQSPRSIGELTQGLYDLSSSGVKAADAQTALSLAAKAATAGVTSVDVAVRSGMAVVNAYGLDMSKLTDVYDLQFKAVELGVMSYEQYAGAIGNVLPSASRLKVDLNELHAALATMTLGGIDAQSASTFLARALDEVTEKSGKFKDVGINVWGPNGAFVGMASLMEQLKSKMQGLPIEQQTELLKKLELQIQSGKAISSLSNMYETFGGVLDQTAKSAGAMDEAAQKINASSKAQYDILKNQLNAEFIKLGEIVLPAVNGALHAITGSGILQFMGDVAKAAIDWAPIPKVIGLIKDEYTWMAEKVGLLDEKLPLVNRNLLMQKEAAQDAADRGIAPLNKEIGMMDAALLSANGSVKQHTELTDEQKKAIEALTRARKEYLDDLRREAREELPVLNAELADLTGFYATIEAMGGKDELGFISTGTVAAVGEIRGNWKDIPPIITDVKGKTDEAAEAARKAAAATQQKREEWQKIVGYIGNVIQLLPGMDSELQSVARGMQSAFSQILGGDVIGGAVTAVTTAIAAIKNQADEANKQELRTFQAYSKEYYALIREVEGMTGINKDSIQSLIDTFETLEQSGQYNRQELIPILRDTIRAMYDAKDAAVAEADAHKNDADATKKNADAHTALNGALKPTVDNSKDIEFWTNKANEAMLAGDDAGEKYALRLVSLMNSGKSLADALNIINGGIDDTTGSVGKFSDKVIELGKEEKKSFPTTEAYNAYLAEEAKLAKEAAVELAFNKNITAGYSDTVAQATKETVKFRDIIEETGKEGKRHFATIEQYNEAERQRIKLLKEADVELNFNKNITAQVAEETDSFGRIVIEVNKEEKKSFPTMEAYNAYLHDQAKEAKEAAVELAFNKNITADYHAEVAKAVDVQALLHEAGIRTKEDIEAEIKLYEDLLPLLEEGSYNYYQVKDKLEDLTGELNKNIPATEKVVTLQEKLKNAGVRTEQEIRDEIASLVALRSELTQGSYDYNVLTGKIEGLNEELGKFDPVAAQVVSLQTQLKNAGIETTQSIIDQIAQYEALLPQLQKGSYEYNQVKDKLDELNDKLIESTLNVQEFGVEWDRQLRFITGQFTQFETDIKQIGDTIEELQYFAIDLDTTDVDESIAASIQLLEQYLATLNPSSQAYTDAKAAIDGLKAKFYELTGVMPADYELVIDTSQAVGAVGAIKSDIAGIPTEKPLDIDESDATSSVSTVTDKVNQIPSTMTFSIDYTGLGMQINNINAYLDYVEVNKVLNISTSAAEAALRGINNQLGAIANGASPFIDVIATDAIATLNTIIAKLAQIVDKTIYVTVVEEPANKHEGGLVRHSGGIVPDLPTAHTGDLFPNETLIRALKNEFVLRPAATTAFGEDKLAAFNATLNPAVLSNRRSDNLPTDGGAESGSGKQPIFVIHEATPKTWVEITDQAIHPRVRTNAYHQVKMNQFRP